MDTGDPSREKVLTSQEDTQGLKTEMLGIETYNLIES